MEYLGLGHLVFWPAKSCDVDEELCLQVKELQEEVSKLQNLKR